jgi:hypothetical protein
MEALVPKVIPRVRKHDVDVRGTPAKYPGEEAEAEGFEPLVHLHEIPGSDLLLKRRVLRVSRYKIVPYEMMGSELTSVGSFGQGPSGSINL